LKTEERFELPATEIDLEPIFSVSDLQRWSGNSESFWRKLIARGELRAVKIGVNTRITKSAINEYMQRPKPPKRAKRGTA
jgi:excisionase family DNA binding protein